MTPALVKTGQPSLSHRLIRFSFNKRFSLCGLRCPNGWNVSPGRQFRSTSGSRRASRFKTEPLLLVSSRLLRPVNLCEAKRACQGSARLQRRLFFDKIDLCARTLYRVFPRLFCGSRAAALRIRPHETESHRCRGVLRLRREAEATCRSRPTPPAREQPRHASHPIPPLCGFTCLTMRRTIRLLKLAEPEQSAAGNRDSAACYAFRR